MTREEAINVIEQLMGIQIGHFTDAEMLTALDMAVDALRNNPNWISVEERLPEENGKTQQSVSVWATNGLMSCEMRYNFDTKKWTDMWGDPFDVTYWMPLPAAPRKEE